MKFYRKYSVLQNYCAIYLLVHTCLPVKERVVTILNTKAKEYVSWGLTAAEIHTADGPPDTAPRTPVLLVLSLSQVAPVESPFSQYESESTILRTLFSKF